MRVAMDIVELLFLFLAIGLVHESCGLRRNDLFPYGSPAGDRRLPSGQEDNSSPEVEVNVPIKFYGREYKSIYVNENGLLSFLTEIPSFFNIQFPLEYPLIAAMYSDVDTRSSGTVWYRNTSDPYLLRRAAEMVNEAFKNYQVQPLEIFIATWDKVGYFEEKGDMINTFQIVIVTDDTDSFVILLYPEGGIQWIKAQGKNRNMPDARAQAGIISGEGRFYILKGSGSDQIRRLNQWSNINQAGVWIYRIGNLGVNGNIESPQITQEGIFNPDYATSCSTGGETKCHSLANCLDDENNPGSFCCECKIGTFGNGEICLSQGVPRRVSGRVSGNINSVGFIEQDLHSYVVTEDGRSYTAISQVPVSIGSDMQALITIGVPIAWLFGQPLSGAQNGFSLTGGEFNYSATVRFPDTRDSVEIKLRFQGLDAFDYQRVVGNITGSLPSIGSRGSEIEVDAYNTEFTRIMPGVIEANEEERTLRVKGSNKVIRYNVQHRIEYEGCKSKDQDPMTRALRFKSSKNYINFDRKEQVVRYASTAKVVPLGADEDPCREVTCSDKSYCKVMDDLRPKCICNPGFEEYYLYENVTACVDIDECSLGRTECSPNADCVNQQGSYGCVCKEGFVGNGFQCEEEITCEKLNCGENAECVLNPYRVPKCQCLSGYVGDGQNCVLEPSDLKLEASADPAIMDFDNTRVIEDVQTREDLGPEFRHIFTLTNYGAHTVGGVLIDVTWPLKDANNRPVSYLMRSPYVRYEDPESGVYLQDCEINPAVIDEEKLRRSRVKRQEDLDYYYEPIDYTKLSEFDKDLLAAYGEEPPAPIGEYDYSQFDVFNTAKPKPAESLTTTTARTEVQRMPDGSRVSEYSYRGEYDTDYSDVYYETYGDGDYNDYDGDNLGENNRYANVDTSMKSEERAREPQQGPGQVTFSCRMNLAPGESARVIVDSMIYTKTLVEDYSTVSNFDFPSEARVQKMESIKFIGSNMASTKTKVKARDPTVAQVPGQGAQCGDIVCHRYADCQNTFDGRSSFECQCLSGFQGDGVTRCEMISDPGVIDCRETGGCHSDAKCDFNNQVGTYTCFCNEGYYGDGYSCIPETSCQVRNDCSPMADCIAVPGRKDTYLCKCRPGYFGDGYTCREDTNGMPIDIGEEPACIFGECTCSFGFTLVDGKCIRDNVDLPVLSTTEEPAKDLCSRDEECDPNASCLYDPVRDIYRCVCKDFYIGDGFSCRPGPDAGCDILKNCGENAKCVQDDNYQYYCKCMDGYSGDGYECKQNMIGCNFINNCGKYASCEFDQQEGGYRCKCDVQRGFDGDGFTCRPFEPCSANPAMCDPNADCVSGGPLGSQCRCRSNFIGDGFTCDEIPTYDGNYLIMAQAMALMKVPLDAGDPGAKPGYPLVVHPSQVATGIDVDCLRGKIYWTDTTGRVIRRANYNGSESEIFLDRDMQFPEGLAIDWASRNLYWIDSGKRTLEVINIDSRVRVLLFDELLWSPRSIALHAHIGRLFWTDWNYDRPKIESANLDGTERFVLVDNLVGMPNSITVDNNRYEVCWADGGSSERGSAKKHPPKLECMGMNGDNRKPVVIFDKADQHRPYGIALSESRIYWTDWKQPGIHVADRETGRRMSSLKHLLQGLSRPYGLVNVPNECPRATSPCQSSENRCQPNQICLPNGRGGVSCRCPNGKDANDQDDCEDVF